MRTNMTQEDGQRSRTDSVSSDIPCEIKLTTLGPDDWLDFKTLRLEALRSEPAAFSSTHAETILRSDESWRQWLANPRCIVLMATVGTIQAGIVGAYLGSDDGDRSVAIVFGMYVAPPFRDRGVGKLLLSSLLDVVSGDPDILTIRLWVTETQVAARRLYEAAGFRVVGRDAVQVQSDGELHDELVMERSVQMAESER
jgi:GNAT superfamily N-acetyltransferase